MNSLAARTAFIIVVVSAVLSAAVLVAVSGARAQAPSASNETATNASCTSNCSQIVALSNASSPATTNATATNVTTYAPADASAPDPLEAQFVKNRWALLLFGTALCFWPAKKFVESRLRKWAWSRTLFHLDESSKKPAFATVPKDFAVPRAHTCPHCSKDFEGPCPLEASVELDANYVTMWRRYMNEHANLVFLLDHWAHAASSETMLLALHGRHLKLSDGTHAVLNVQWLTSAAYERLRGSNEGPNRADAREDPAAPSRETTRDALAPSAERAAPEPTPIEVVVGTNGHGNGHHAAEAPSPKRAAPRLQVRKFVSFEFPSLQSDPDENAAGDDVDGARGDASSGRRE